MHVVFLPIMQIYRMYREMGPRFFERNIRAGLSADRPPNRAIRQSLQKMVLKAQDPSDIFAFNHNGITLAAENLQFNDDKTEAVVTEPRLLNGAQTVTSLHKFITDNEGNSAIKDNKALEDISVMAKIICGASNEFIINVTVCNNRQNPVDPWNLRASDPIQLELQDKFIEDLRIYYERQEEAFQGLSDEDLADMGVEQYKAIQIKPLAQTFLGVQGEIDKMSRMPDVFESETLYKNTFRESYLRSDAREILLAYKIRFRLSRIVWDIVEKGTNKYSYLGHARNLVWALLIQGILNDPNLSTLGERFGTDLSMESDFTEYLKTLASTRIRFVVSKAIDDARYHEMIDSEKYSFLRTKAIYDRCLDAAYSKYRWKKRTF
jgi:hypothetical protein